MSQISTHEVLEWTTQFLTNAKNELSIEELKEQKKFASLVRTPSNKTLLCKMMDESSQIKNNGKLARRMKLLISKYGVPDFFSPLDQVQLQLFTRIGYLFASISIPLFKNRLRQETDKIIIAEERPNLTKHLKGRWDAHIGQNVNLLGEVVLGDEEARKRYESYLDALKEPDINYISIKLSGIYAQIRSLAYEQNKKDLCYLVANIFQQAIDHPYVDHDGVSKPKFVNLDMEEYKDVEITLDVFETVLLMPQFKNYTAGIVVQAYLPDAKGMLERLLKFAKTRCTDGGQPLKVRLVKGANLQMESIISSLKGWRNPIYETKIEVDANYMNILDLAFKPENAQAVHIGVASHNFFTIGYAALLSEKNGVQDCVSFEMLEGMANHLPRVMKKLGKQIVLYTPVVKKENFLNAVSYLVRRLDENTGKDNFLSYSFNLEIDNQDWKFLVGQFEEAYKLKDTLNTQPRRIQDRTTAAEPVSDTTVFKNEADTDFDRNKNRTWGLATLKHWENDVRDTNFKIPVQIGAAELETKHKYKYYDRSKNDEVCFCEASMSTHEQVMEIVKTAEADLSGWRKKTVQERADILYKAGDKLGEQRDNLLGCMAAITGKSITEGDVEASEAIDFCRFYATSMLKLDKMEGVSHQPKGSILVISPWNFPLAIPVGGVASALASGNTVLLKPATVALPIAWKFAQCFWDAGVPKDSLQVICTAERQSLDYITSHSAIKHIIFTGGTDTAFKLLENSPRTPLSAETGGKNAIILTSSGDQDHAILNVIPSAFGNAGQKCSACSLLLVDKKTYNDSSFKAKLKDATLSLRTGSVWDTMNLVGPMITNDNEKLLHAINNLEEGEEWLVAPEFVDEKRYILKPTIKWGVKPKSFTFRNELFAPLLSVVCIDNLEQGIEYVNSLEYGLTSGLQSLDEKEKNLWKNKIEAGNLYINRGITGAIVNRQPFGGMKQSAFGGGIKAGGPNYVSCFVNFTEKSVQGQSIDKSQLSYLLTDNSSNERLNYAFTSYKKAYKEEFSQEKDINQLNGEENTFRYLPLKSMIFRVQESDLLEDVLMVLEASRLVKTPLTISVLSFDKKMSSIKQACALAKVLLKVETDAEFIFNMQNYDRVRSCSASLSDAIYKKAAEMGKYLATNKPIVEGRLELLNYLQEQSIAHEYHRYGSAFDEEASAF